MGRVGKILQRSSVKQGRPKSLVCYISSSVIFILLPIQKYKNDHLQGYSYRRRNVGRHIQIQIVENGALYEVYGKHVTRKIGDVELAGSNPSAEEAEEGTDEAVESGVDIVLNQRLQEVCGLKKKDFIEYLKKYMKKILEKFPEDKKDEFKTSMNSCSKMLLGKFKELQFFHGESFDYGIDERMLCMCEYIGEDPVMYFFRWGLEEEKV